MIQAPKLREPYDEPLRPDRLRVERDRTVAAQQAAWRPQCGRPVRAQRHHVGLPVSNPMAWVSRPPALESTDAVDRLPSPRLLRRTSACVADGRRTPSGRARMKSAAASERTGVPARVLDPDLRPACRDAACAPGVVAKSKRSRSTSRNRAREFLDTDFRDCVPGSSCPVVGRRTARVPTSVAFRCSCRITRGQQCALDDTREGSTGRCTASLSGQSSAARNGSSSWTTSSYWRAAWLRKEVAPVRLSHKLRTGYQARVSGSGSMVEMKSRIS